MDGVFLFLVLVGALVALDVTALRFGAQVPDSSTESRTPAATAS